jgi:hypothetical protein
MYLNTSVVEETFFEGEAAKVLSSQMESWTFCLVDSVLVLDSYTRSIKEIGKRKYSIVKYYNRIMRRDSTLTMDEVPFPENVQIKAKNDIMNQITVSMKLRGE